MVYALVSITLFFILFLLSHLTRSNPFERVLWKPRHYIHYGADGVLEISIAAGKHSDTVLKDAVHAAYYSYPDSNSLLIRTSAPMPLDMEQIFQFPHIKRLNLRDFRQSQTKEFGIWDYPLETIIIPKESEKIEFCSNLHNLEYIVIPCSKMIPAAATQHYFSGICSVTVYKPLRIIVPEDLILLYESDDSWKNVHFVTESGEPYVPEFSCPNKYYWSNIRK